MIANPTNIPTIMPIRVARGRELNPVLVETGAKVSTPVSVGSEAVVDDVVAGVLLVDVGTGYLSPVVNGMVTVHLPLLHSSKAWIECQSD